MSCCAQAGAMGQVERSGSSLIHGFSTYLQGGIPAGLRISPTALLLCRAPTPTASTPGAGRAAKPGEKGQSQESEQEDSKLKLKPGDKMCQINFVEFIDSLAELHFIYGVIAVVVSGAHTFYMTRLYQSALCCTLLFLENLSKQN